MDNKNRKRNKFQKVKLLSPFEIKDKLIHLAKNHKEKCNHMLNAGRGNPNWTAATPREAFFKFGLFAVEETRRIWNDGIWLECQEKKDI